MTSNARGGHTRREDAGVPGPYREQTKLVLVDMCRAILATEELAASDNFFALGGHSLLAAQLLAKIRRSWGIRLQLSAIYDNPIIADLAAYIDAQVRSSASQDAETGRSVSRQGTFPLVQLEQSALDRIAASAAMQGSSVEDIYPLLPLQEGFLFHHLLDRQADAYVLRVALLFANRAILDRFLDGLKRAIERHAALRTAIFWEGSPQPVQVVYRSSRFTPDHVSLDDGADIEACIEKVLSRESSSFRLEVAPLLKVSIGQYRGGQWLMGLSVHHIVSDEISLRNLLQEAAMPPDSVLPQVLGTHRDFVLRALATEQEERAKRYFGQRLRTFSETSAPFQLLDVHKGAIGTAEASLRIDESLVKKLRLVATRFGVSTAAFFHAAYGVLVAHTSGRQDIVFGTVLSARVGDNDLSFTQGMFINTLPLRLSVGGASVAQFVKSVQQELAALLQHEHASLVLARQCSGLTGAAPLFTAVLNYRRAAKALDMSDRQIEVLRLQDRTNYPATLAIDDTDDGCLLNAQSDSRIAPERLAELFKASLRLLVDAADASPDTQVLQVVRQAGDALTHSRPGRQAARRPRTTAEIRDAMKVAGSGARASFEAATETEQKLAAIWRDVLKVDFVGRGDNFFDRGGHSLRAMLLLSKIRQEWNRELSLNTILEHPVLSRLATMIDSLGTDRVVTVRAAAGPRLPKAPRADNYPTSANQRQIWLSERRFPGNRTNHVVAVASIRGSGSSTGDVRDVVRATLEKHSVLRSVFVHAQGNLVQKPAASFPSLQKIECGSIDGIEGVIDGFATPPFDLESGPLVRVIEVTVPSVGERILAWVAHRIVCDSASLDLVSRRAAALLKGSRFKDHEPDPLNDYIDYVSWESGSQELAAAKEYWLSVLAGCRAPAGRPSDHGGESAASSAMSGHCLLASPRLMHSIRKACVEEVTTPFVVLTAGLIAAHARRTKRTDLVIGVPCSGRVHPCSQEMVGPFANVMLIRARIDLAGDFSKLVADVKAQLREGQHHQNYSFYQLLTDAGHVGDGFLQRLAPVFVKSVALNEADERRARRNLGHRQMDGIARCDWEFQFLQRGDSLFLECQYKRVAFRPEAVEEFSQSYQRLLERLLANRREPLGASIVGSEEQENPEQQALQFWARSLAGVPTLHSLPAIAQRGAASRGRSTVRHLDLSSIAHALAELANKCNTTIAIVALAAFQAVLSRYSGEDDVCVLAIVPIPEPKPGQNNRRVIPARATLGAGQTYAEVLEQIKNRLAEACLQPDVDVRLVAEQLGSNVSTSNAPLFQISFAFDEMGEADYRADLSLALSRTQGKLACRVAYEADLFDAIMIEGLVAHYAIALRQVCESPRVRLDQLLRLTDAESRKILVEWNQTQTSSPPDLCVHELFESRVLKSPDATALVLEGQSLSYRALNSLANRLAAKLRTLSIGPDVLVGICLERSVEMIVALLAILKAGGAYLPLDPSYPKERLAYMLGDAQPKLLVTKQSLLNRLPRFESVLLMDQESAQSSAPMDNLRVDVRPHHRAYVIYTSGSTGAPKGVEIEHRSLVNFLDSMCRQLKMASNDAVLSITSLSFDIFGLELYVPLVTGARVALASEDEARDAEALREIIDRCAVTVVQATPATWRLLQQSADELPWKKTLRLALCGGEAWDGKLAEFLSNHAEVVWNMYGPTEATIWCTMAQVRPGNRITLGRPIGNTEIYVLDQHLEPLPIGAPGELYIGGRGLARGYLNRPDLTAERFIPHPFRSEAGLRLYKTGDRARYLPDGSVEFLGRVDHQVKLRGFRIELQEIECLLQQLPWIRQAIVVLRKDVPGQEKLIAYLVLKQATSPSGNGPSPQLADDDLRAITQALRAKLPEYMLPASYVVLGRLPMTPNGKVDRNNLPMPGIVRRPEAGAPPTL